MSFGYKTKFLRDNAGSYVQVAGLIDLQDAEITRPSVQTTNLDASGQDAGYHDFSPSPLRDAGELSIVLEWDEADPGQVALAADLDLDTPVNYRVEYPDGTTVTCSGFITSWGKAVPMEERITRTIKFKRSGKPVIA